MLTVMKVTSESLTAPEASNVFVKQLEGKARTSYSKATRDVQAKMIINARVKDSENLFEKFLYDQMVCQFPSILTTSSQHDEIISSFRKISMELSPWLDYATGVPEEFERMISNPMESNGLRGLFSHIMLQNGESSGPTDSVTE